MHVKTALALSATKWLYIVNNEGRFAGFLEENKSFLKFKNHCPLCELFVNKNCVDCPMYIKKGSERIKCGNEKHPYEIWRKNQNEGSAQEMLDLIIDLI